MPTYVYKCTDCDDYVDLVRPMTEADAPANCAACGADRARVFLAAGSSDDAARRVPAGKVRFRDSRR